MILMLKGFYHSQQILFVFMKLPQIGKKWFELCIGFIFQILDFISWIMQERFFFFLRMVMILNEYFLFVIIKILLPRAGKTG